MDANCGPPSDQNTSGMAVQANSSLDTVGGTCGFAHEDNIKPIYIAIYNNEVTPTRMVKKSVASSSKGRDGCGLAIIGSLLWDGRWL